MIFVILLVIVGVCALYLAPRMVRPTPPVHELTRIPPIEPPSLGEQIDVRL